MGAIEAFKANHGQQPKCRDDAAWKCYLTLKGKGKNQSTALLTHKHTYSYVCTYVLALMKTKKKKNMLLPKMVVGKALTKLKKKKMKNSGRRRSGIGSKDTNGKQDFECSRKNTLHSKRVVE